MATSVSFNGSTYSVPASGERNWSSLSTYLIAIASGALSKAGGSFTLTSADVDFGATYGLKAVKFSSRSTPATTGLVRLGNAEYVAWRNAANSADLGMRVNSSNVLEFNGNPLLTLALGAADTALRMNAGGTAYEWAKLTNANVDTAAAIAYSKLNLAVSIVNADVATAAAIARSKLASGTASHVLINDGSGVMSSEASLAITRGGTGQATANAGINALLPSQGGNTGKVLKTDGTDTSWVAVASTVTTTRGDLIYRAASADDRLAIGTKGKHLRAGASDPEWAFNATSAQSASYVVLDNDGFDVILVTTGGSNRTVTLPTAADNPGRQITVIKADSGSGTLTLDGEGAETIDGAATWTVLSQYGRMSVVCNGSAWFFTQPLEDTGTFTPVFKEGANTLTVASTTGRYVRIGRTCYIDIMFSNITDPGAGATGVLTVTGLPFTSAGSSALAIRDFNRFTAPASALFLQSYVDGAGTTIGLYWFKTGDFGPLAAVGTDITTASGIADFCTSGTYQTSAA